MRALRLALAGILAVVLPIAAHAKGPESDMKPVDVGPVSGIVLAWDGGGSDRHAEAIGGNPGGHDRQWNGGRVRPHWGPHRQPQPPGWGPYGWHGVPTYWVWGPSGGAFDYPFQDPREPFAGWGE